MTYIYENGNERNLSINSSTNATDITKLLYEKEDVEYLFIEAVFSGNSQLDIDVMRIIEDEREKYFKMSSIEPDICRTPENMLLD